MGYFSDGVPWEIERPMRFFSRGKLKESELLSSVTNVDKIKPKKPERKAKKKETGETKLPVFVGKL